MTKDELYNVLLHAMYRHQRNNTKCLTYVNDVIKVVKKYLESNSKQALKECEE